MITQKNDEAGDSALLGGSSMTDSLFYQRFVNTLSKAVNDSAEGRIISPQVIQDLLGANRRYVTPRIQIQLENVVKRNQFLTGAEKIE
jgi:hypothetical protein